MSNIEQAAHTRMGVFLLCLFNEMQNAGIRYCILRNYALLPDDTKNDVDLLVEPGQIDVCLALIEELALANRWRIIRVHRRMGIVKMFLVCADKLVGERQVLELDCLWANLWRGIQVASVDIVLDTAQAYRGFLVASPGASAAVSFAKEYLQNGKMGRDEKEVRNKALFHSSVHGDHPTFVRTLAPGFGERLAGQIADHIVEENWCWFSTNLQHIRRIALTRSLQHNSLKQVADWLSYAKWHFADKVIRPSGLMVAFCGPDGSGKTTISRRVMRDLTTSFEQAFPAVIYRHSRFGLLPELRVIYNWIGHWLGLPTKKPLTVEQATRMLDEPPLHPVRAMVNLAYYTTDYMLGYFILLRARSRGQVVVFDRYYYDFLIHNVYDRIPESLRWWLSTLVPQPQLLIYLKGDPDVIHRRKPELRAGQIAAQQAVCERIIKHTPQGRTCYVDSTVDEISAYVVEELFECLWQQSCRKLTENR